jgi:hypothetical protein
MATFWLSNGFSLSHTLAELEGHSAKVMQDISNEGLSEAHWRSTSCHNLRLFCRQRASSLVFPSRSTIFEPGLDGLVQCQCPNFVKVES